MGTLMHTIGFSPLLSLLVVTLISLLIILAVNIYNVFIK